MEKLKAEFIEAPIEIKEEEMEVGGVSEFDIPTDNIEGVVSEGEKVQNGRKSEKELKDELKRVKSADRAIKMFSIFGKERLEELEEVAV